jgi:S1-C subfamily serine protease
VEAVEDGGCADKAGLIAGDVILAVKGIRVESGEALTEILYGMSAGDALELSVYRYRGGNQFTVTLTLDEAGG